MRPSLRAANEALRLAACGHDRVLDAPQERAADGIDLAAGRFPGIFLFLILPAAELQQWLKSRFGSATGRTWADKITPHSFQRFCRRSCRLVLAALALILQLHCVRGATNGPVSAGGAGTPRHIVFGSDQDYPPFEWLDKNGQPQGFNVDLVRALGKVMGWDVEIRLGPWREIRQGLEGDGTVDISDMFFTEERARTVDFSVPFWVVHDEVFVRRGSPQIKSLSDLAGREVLCQEDSAAAHLLAQTVPTVRLIQVRSEPEALRRLAAGQYEYAVVTRLAGRHAVIENDLRNLTTTGSPLWPRDYSLVTAKGHPELLAQINQGLAILKENGRFDEICDKWFSELLPRKPWLEKLLALLPWIVAGVGVLAAAVTTWIWTLRRQVLQRTRQLRKSETNYRTLFESASDGIFISDEQGRHLAVNAQGCRMLGYTRDELLGLTISDVITLAEKIRLSPEMARLKAGETVRSEWQCRRKDGTVFSCETSASILPDGRVLAIRRDISDRKRAEQRIQQLNRTLAVLSDINQLIVREKETAAMLAAACQIAVEKGLFRLAWIGLADSAGSRLRVSAHAGATEDTLRILQPLVEGERPDCAFTFQALSGRSGVCNDIAHDPRAAGWRDAALERDYRAMASMPLKTGNQVIGTFNLYAAEPDFFDPEELRVLEELAMDVSFGLEVGRREQERRLTEDELRSRTAFFEAQVDSSLDGILVVDNRGRKILQNRRMNQLWKIPPEIAANPEDALQVRFVTRQIKQPQPFVERIAYINSHPGEVSRDIIELIDGTVLDRSSAPVLDKTGKNYGRIWTFRDITEQRQLEAQYRQAQKMEAVGQLAGGVAHDFNNILAVITMQSELAAGVEHTPEEVRVGLREIGFAAERAASLTRQLLAFSRRQVMQTRVLDLNECVMSLSSMLQRILGEDVRLQLTLQPGSLMVRADAGMLDQVLLNLVVNARDAMPGGGRLLIETGEKLFSPDEAKAVPESAPGRHACLRVTDTGTGIPPESLPRIFEPFFTTKEPGKGTGLGLATVFGIIKQHRGFVTVASELGKGTTFRIFLPATEEAGESSEDTAIKPRAHGTETILLVEDESSVRRLTRAVLELAGYRVIEAADGREALRIVEQHPGAIHLLFTDIVMPEGLSGYDLAARLRVIRPQLRVIFTSGYSADIAGRDLSLHEGQNFIPKPAPTQQLLDTVRRCLDS